jgi:hypothetical protein
MSRMLFIALGMMFMFVVLDKRPILVQSEQFIARQVGARSIVRCTYLGTRGLIEDEYRFSSSSRGDPPACPVFRPARDVSST